MPSRTVFTAILVLALIAGCADTRPPTIPAGFTGPAAAGPADGADGGSGYAAASTRVPPPELRIPPYLPIVPELPAPNNPGVTTPSPTVPPGGWSSTPANLGPVTGYGTGGMAQPPGAPPNPPYPPGGLLH